MSTATPDPIPPPNNLSPVLPEKFLGVFRTRRCGGETDEAPPESYKATLKLADLDLAQPLDPMPLGVPSSVQVFHDDGVAFYSNSVGDPNNKTILDNLLAKLAEDFFLFRSVSFDLVYIGMYALKPVAVVDYIEFVYDDNTPADDDNQDDQIIELVEDRMRPNCYTRILSEPWDGYPEWFQHWDKNSFTGDCIDSHDRTPGLLMLMPGGVGGGPGGGSSGAVGFAAGILTLEDGRLVRVYEKGVTISCGCSPPCGMVCTTITGLGNLKGITVTAKTQPIDHVTITSGGAGYTHPPGVNFSTANGNGGVGIAVLDGSGHVTGVTITAGGAYTGVVLLTFNNAGTGATTGAIGTVTLGADVIVNTCITDGIVASVTVGLAGSGYTSIPTATVIGGGGSGVIITVFMKLVAQPIIVSGGSGYAVGQVTNVVGGTFLAGSAAALRVTAIGAGGTITGMALQTVGIYSALPANPATVAGGTAGTGAQFNLSWGVSGLTLTDPGSGFTSTPTLTISPPGTTGGVTAQGSVTIAFKCCLGVFISGSYKISTDACTPPVTIARVSCPTNTNITIAAAGFAAVKFIPCGLCSNLGLAGSGPTSIRMTGFGISTTVPVVEGSGATCVFQFGIARTGIYTFELLDGNCYYPETHSVFVADCVALPVDLTIAPQSKQYNNGFTIRGCNGLPLSGATVTLTGTAYGGTQVSNAAGIVIFSGVPADCDLFITTTYPRFVTLGPTAYRSPCSDSDPAINILPFQTPIVGYRCVPCVAYPVPEILHGTCSEGAFLLKFDGNITWIGCHTTGGKRTVCLQGFGLCRAKQDLGGHTIYTDGGTVALEWGWACLTNLLTGQIVSRTPGGQAEDETFVGEATSGNPYRPFPGCCDDDSNGISRSGFVGTSPCGLDTDVCNIQRIPNPDPTSCSGGSVGYIIGTYPVNPPMNATYRIVDLGGMGFPSGTVTISE